MNSQNMVCCSLRNAWPLAFTWDGYETRAQIVEQADRLSALLQKQREGVE
ncbi:hypothetical protein PSCT_04513 [Pseudomonas sp. SCT]|nr:hypothetical protein PSCT_04513 [Pseudomonas sp. SCT]